MVAACRPAPHLATGGRCWRFACNQRSMPWMHGHERGGLPAAAPAATQRNYNVPGGGSRTWPCHGTARMQAAVVARLPDRRTAAAGCADMGKKSWSQTPAPIAPRSSHHLGRVLSSYFTGFFLARKRRLRYQHAREFCVGKNMHPKIRSCSVIMIQYGLNRIRIN